MLSDDHEDWVEAASEGDEKKKEIEEAYEERIAKLTEDHIECQAQLETKLRVLTTDRERIQQELSAQSVELQSAKEKLTSSELLIKDLKCQVDFFQNPPIPPLKYDHRSLCKVDSTGGRIWLIRLADLSGDALTSFSVDQSKPKMFDNRDRLYHKNGPSEHGYFGVWDWKASPNNSDPEKDYVESFYCSDLSPIEVVTVDGKRNVDSVITDLQTGFEYRPSTARIMFSVYRGAGTYVGVLCSSGDLESKEEKVVLSECTYYLPLYEFSAHDLITIEGKRFYRKINLGPEKGKISIIDPLEIAKMILLKKMTWPVAKEYGYIRAQWQSIRSFLNTLETDDYYQSVMEACGCSLSDAHSYTAQLLEKAESCIKVDDVDSNLLASIAKNLSFRKNQKTTKTKYRE